MSHSKTVFLAFDIYGTILDTSAIAPALAEHAQIPLEKAKAVTQEWRKYQLEYTWRMNSMEIYETFREVTRKALVHACKDAAIELDRHAIEALMDVYDHLPAFSESSSAWKDINAISGIETLIFSNGTQAMVTTALRHAFVDPWPKAFYLVDDAGLRLSEGDSLKSQKQQKKYKPAKEVYEHLLISIGQQETRSNVWLVSCNPFDVTGALSVGMNAIWVDRAGAGWTDQLYSSRGPTKVVNDLDGIVQYVKDSLL
ncbi:haloacid dehalogenase [Punctularia strigosozonata HHB-11173 SS5]|uniref:haloacid dehalogenase n=1 Tax=Punctularia strigosozonata (strain HHB-11173) TaxID=741275 RepID=UPI00044185FA|nr:haloacid dehalogenase [Punctularia strigosozonata HHB-11173 SS5]EIN05523.1 haloacid dehalogenase [Punctularia strigosozonata HHB-11173 SS5]